MVRRALATSTPLRAKCVQTTSTSLTANGKALVIVKFASISSIRAFDQWKAAIRTKRSGRAVRSGAAKANAAALQSASSAAGLAARIFRKAGHGRSRSLLIGIARPVVAPES